MIYFPGLNGIRAIAALFVLFAHTTQKLNEFGLDKFIFGIDPNGNSFGSFLAGVGVSMFFALSGFLITFLLLKEKENNSINIKHFYIRRIFRIWPLYFFYLAITIIITYINFNEFPGANIFYYIFIAANIPFIFGGSINFVNHYWSLGVEEQFYLIWPIILKKININNVVKYLTYIFILTFGLKVIFYFLELFFGYSIPFYFLYVNRYDCMVIGAIGGALYANGYEKPLTILSSVWSQLVAWLIVLFYILNGTFGKLLSFEIASLVTVVIILSHVLSSKILINLENKVLNFIGKISFGIYVYHIIIIFLLSNVIKFENQNVISGYFTVYILVLTLTLIIAYLSYQYLEKPFLKYKVNFATIKSTN